MSHLHFGVLCTLSLVLGCQQAEPTPLRFDQPAKALAAAPADGKVEIIDRPLDKIPVGTIIDKKAPEGWSHLVLIATPTLNEQDRKDAPKIAGHYAQLFKFTILANVAKQGASYRLDKLARGFAIDIKGQQTVIDNRNTFKADLGQFGRMILEENEKHLDADVRQVVRTETMLIFDAQAVMRQGDDHVKQVMRHAIVVVPETGQLGCFIWLLDKKETDGRLQPIEKQLQLLPANMQEERLLSVKRDKFNVLGIPTPEAFALMRVPPGTAIPYTAELTSAATPKTFTKEQVLTLEGLLRDLLRKQKP